MGSQSAGRDVSHSRRWCYADPLSQQIIYGNVTSITRTREGAQFLLAIDKGDNAALKEHLVKVGIAQSDADELVKIVEADGIRTKTRCSKPTEASHSKK